MSHQQLAIRRAVAAAAAVIFGIFLIAEWPTAQEGAQGKPRPDAVAAAGRGASGPKNVIEGTDEDDRLTGTDSEDWVFGRKGQDIIAGGRGRDVVDAGEGEDTIDGGADNDIIDGGAGNDLIRGGDGDDTIEGSDDDDVIDGGGGADDADGGDGNDVLRGAGGNDVLAGGDGADTLFGGPGDDRLSGNDGFDSILGGVGNDGIAGGDGDDTLDGEAGEDTVDGGQGNDTLRGGAGNDTLTGSVGGDFVDGGNDQDTLFGGDGRDVVTGGSGSDLLLGGGGTDVVDGNEGDDIIVIRAGDVARGDTEITDGGAGEDLLTLNGFTLRDVTAGQFTDPLTTGSYRIANVERVQHTYVLPHIGLDPTRTTSLLLVNPSAEASLGRIVFYGTDGASVTARADALKGGTFTVPPLGAVTIDAFAPQAALVASAQVFSNVPLGLSVQTATAAAGTAAASEATLLDGAVVPISDDQAGGTGVLIANSLFRSRVKLTVRSATGGELECCSTTVDMLPYAQRVVWVRELFPRLGEFQGALTVDVNNERPQEGGPIAIVALQRRGPIVTASPAVRLTTGAATGAVVFSAVTAGGDATSSLIVVNPSVTARARGTVSFADPQGRPWPIGVNKQPAAPRVPFDLAPFGTLVLTLPTGGAIQTGLARVDTTEGDVGAVMRSASATTLVDAAPATAATAFVTAAVRDRAAGTTTELTIASSGPAATVQIALHDQSGAPVQGALAQVRVPAGGQVARTFDELFPKAPAQTFQGTIVATSDQRVVASMIRSTGGQRATLPVLPTR